MNKFIVRAGILCAFIVGTCVMIYALPTPYSHDLAAILNKRDLLKDPSERRIIFVGGSGLLGLDSVMIQERCSRSQVVNMGLYAGFGITALLDTVKPYLRHNDIVVIIPEYTVIFDSYDEHARKWIFALDPNRNLTKLYGGSLAGASLFFKDVFGLIKIKLNTLSKAVKEVKRTKNWHGLINNGNVFYRNKFDENGDHLILGPAFPKDKIRRSEYLSEPTYQGQSFAALNEFNRFAAGKGAQTFFMFPAYPDEEYYLDMQAIERFHRRLTNELGMPVLGRPADFIFPYEYFSDTVYHLTKEGEKLRNERLIAILQQAGIGGAQGEPLR
jgi:hypothetical protein